MERLVYAWFTPDYRAPAVDLMCNLDRLGERYQIDQVAKDDGGWERNTLRKPSLVRAAMDRHPDHTIILLDVDCEVRRPLTDLAGISGDIALRMKSWRSARAGVYLGVRSGTMVLRPTAATRQFLDLWVRLSDAAPRGAIDQHTLALAIGRSPMLSITALAPEWCAVPGDGVANPAILHGQASKGQRKMSKWVRRLFAIGHDSRAVPA